MHYVTRNKLKVTIASDSLGPTSSVMDRNGWQRRQQHPQDQQSRSATTNSVQDAQALLAAYPMASATPTHHGEIVPCVPFSILLTEWSVARHLSTMSYPAQPPSFVQPSYYSTHSVTYPQTNPPPPYTEYAQEITYLASSQPHIGGTEYWENTRNDAVNLLTNPPDSYVCWTVFIFPTEFLFL
jgi:cohesin loading factor subunit SCC2